MICDLKPQSNYLGVNKARLWPGTGAIGHMLSINLATRTGVGPAGIPAIRESLMEGGSICHHSDEEQQRQRPHFLPSFAMHSRSKLTARSCSKPPLRSGKGCFKRISNATMAPTDVIRVEGLSKLGSMLPPRSGRPPTSLTCGRKVEGQRRGQQKQGGAGFADFTASASRKRPQLHSLDSQ